MEEILDHKNLPSITKNIAQTIKKHRYEIVDEPKKSNPKNF